MDKDTNVATLETLTTTLIDSINGYEESAKQTENGRLRQMFDQSGEQPAAFGRAD